MKTAKFTWRSWVTFVDKFLLHNLTTWEIVLWCCSPSLFLHYPVSYFFFFFLPSRIFNKKKILAEKLGKPRTGPSTPSISNLCWVEGKDHLLPCAGQDPHNEAQGATGLCYKGALVAHGQCGVQKNPLSSANCLAALESPVCTGVWGYSFRMYHFTFPCAEFQ